MTSRGEVTVREMPPEMAPASESTSARRICDGSSSEPIGGGGGGAARRDETGRVAGEARPGWFGFWKEAVWLLGRRGGGGLVGRVARLDRPLRLVQVHQRGGGLLRRDLETGLLLCLSKRNVLSVLTRSPE